MSITETQNILSIGPNTQDIQNPLNNPEQTPPPIDPNQQLNIQMPRAEKTVVCWNCLSVLIVKDEWNVIECSECHKLNRVPHEDFPGDQKISLADSYNHFDVNIPFVFGIVICPFCKTENKFRRDSDHVVCFKCHHSFNVDGHIGTNNVNYNFPNRNYYRFSDMYPDIINYRGFYPQPIPIPKCNCAETELMLQKILKTIKKRNKEPEPIKRNFMPYPFPFYNPYMFMGRFPRYDDNDDRDRGRRGITPDIKYIPIPEEPKEPVQDEGFKITIRKKPKFSNSGVMGGNNDKVSRSAAFEKIFYTK